MGSEVLSPRPGDPVRSLILTSGLDAITEREAGVLGLVADGLTNEALALRLHISVKTVEASMASLFRHLGLTESWDVNRRVTAAVAYVYRELGQPLLALAPPPTRSTDEDVEVVAEVAALGVVAPGRSLDEA